MGPSTRDYLTALKGAQVITPIVSGALLEHLGYQTLMPYGAMFVGLAFLTMMMVQHGDSKPIAPRSKLEVFDVVSFLSLYHCTR